MARKVRQITELEIDEISLVDKGANQHAVVTIAKNAGDEKENEMDVFDEQGNPLDVAGLSEGDTVYDSQGEAYVMALEDEDDEQYAQYEDEHDPVPVGKSHNPFRRESVSKASGNFAEEIRKSLDNASSDRERTEIITKALGQVSSLSREVEIAKAAAETERELRLEREYTEVAKSYNLPIEDGVLGGVLKRCAESLPTEDCEIISKCLEVAGQSFMDEYGYVGGGDNYDVMSQIDAAYDETVSKGDSTREEAVTSFFAENPEAYDEYLSN